jgi:cytochrome c peroxidase
VRALVVCLVVSSGCWTEQRVDDVFTQGEWDYLQTFRLDRLAPITCTDARCATIARFGQKLFFDPSYSADGRVACTTCHNPNGFFADLDPEKPQELHAQSFGVGWTKRNVPGLVDLGFRAQFTWGGGYQQVEDVLGLALTNAAALSSTPEELTKTIKSSYGEVYAQLFGDDPHVYENARLAIGVYEQQLVSGPSPFDRYLDGDTTAIDSAAKRGAQLFIGKALCSECHTGPLFTDDQFHVTGIEQRGEHAPTVDDGRFKVTNVDGDLGRFRTPTLRHVAKTAPYMHAGQLDTLGAVVDFYRWGGNPGGFVGVKDPRIVPLEIDDEDARDLEAFLFTLTGTPVAPTWTVQP